MVYKYSHNFERLEQNIKKFVNLKKINGDTKAFSYGHLQTGK